MLFRSRHTGCTRLGENNVNPKVMQYVMGHSDAQITMNVDVYKRQDMKNDEPEIKPAYKNPLMEHYR